MGRGWTGAWTNMRWATQQKIEYGSGVLAAHSAQWPHYVAVTGRRAIDTAMPFLSREPDAVLIPDALDNDYLAALVRELPSASEIEQVVGIGGGKSLDAAKYASLALDVPLVNVPAVTSTGAIVHSLWGSFKGRGAPIGDMNDWPYSDPEVILIDDDYILSAPQHLNAAGLGDTLCWWAPIAEWMYQARTGRGPDWDQELATAAIARFQNLVDRVTSSFDDNGRYTGETLQIVVSALQNRNDLRVPVPDGDERADAMSAFGQQQFMDLPLGEHAFERYLEVANDKSWIHGELTALGTLVISWYVNGDVDRIKRWMDQCHVRWRPLDQGISREELARGLAAASTAIPHKGPVNFETVLKHEPITGAKFDELWKFLTTA